MRYLGLATNSAEKLARFLLDLKPVKGTTAKDGKFLLNLNHEEIAASIGTARETVSRLLTSFKRKNLIALKGSVLTIPNKKMLEALLE